MAGRRQGEARAAARRALRIRPFDRARSLETLEQKRWPEPSFESHVVTRCHALRRVPLAELSVEDLRLLIAQRIGLRFVVPLALERIAVDPLIGGDFYPGDLLSALLRVPAEFWEVNPAERGRVEALLATVELPSDLAEAAREFRAVAR